MKVSKDKDTVVMKCSHKEARLVAAACAQAAELQYGYGTAAKMDSLTKVALQVSSEYNAIAEKVLTCVSFCENV